MSSTWVYSGCGAREYVRDDKLVGAGACARENVVELEREPALEALRDLYNVYVAVRRGHGQWRGASE